MDDGEGNVLEALVLGIRWMPVRMGCDPTVSFSSPKMTPLPSTTTLTTKKIGHV